MRTIPMKRIALAVAAVALLTAGTSFATEPVNQGGVKLNNVYVETYNHDNFNSAYGDDNTAVQLNGSIVGEVDATNLDFYSHNEWNYNTADGSKNEAVQSNGSIVGADPFAE
jgi:hypothetical protein